MVTQNTLRTCKGEQVCFQENKSDSRICKVYDDKGVITVFPGKIDHIFYAYQKVKNCLKRF